MKFCLLFAVVVLLVGGGLTVAIAQADSESFTGCLTGGGTLHKIAIGDEPAQPCFPGQTEVSWNSQGPPGPPGGDDRPSLYNHLCNEILEPGEDPIDVMTLEVPAGSWLAHISIQAGALGPCGGGDPLEGESLSGNYDCILRGDFSNSGGHPASSRVGDFRTLAWSEPLFLKQETTVAVSCQLSDGSGPGATLSVGDLVITPIFSFVRP